MANDRSIEKASLRELGAMASSLGLEHWSQLRKAELAEAIRERQAQLAAAGRPKRKNARKSKAVEELAKEELAEPKPRKRRGRKPGTHASESVDAAPLFAEAFEEKKVGRKSEKKIGKRAETKNAELPSAEPVLEKKRRGRRGRAANLSQLVEQAAVESTAATEKTKTKRVGKSNDAERTESVRKPRVHQTLSASGYPTITFPGRTEYVVVGSPLVDSAAWSSGSGYFSEIVTSGITPTVVASEPQKVSNRKKRGRAKNTEVEYAVQAEAAVDESKVELEEAVVEAEAVEESNDEVKTEKKTSRRGRKPRKARHETVDVPEDDEQAGEETADLTPDPTPLFSAEIEESEDVVGSVDPVDDPVDDPIDDPVELDGANDPIDEEKTPVVKKRRGRGRKARPSVEEPLAEPQTETEEEQTVENDVQVDEPDETKETSETVSEEQEVSEVRKPRRRGRKGNKTAQKSKSGAAESDPQEDASLLDEPAEAVSAPADPSDESKPSAPVKAVSEEPASKPVSERTRTLREQMRTRKILGSSKDKFDRVVLTACDSYWLRACWEVTPQLVDRIRCAMGRHWHTADPILRVYTVDREMKYGSSRRAPYADIEIRGGLGSWYLNVDNPPCSFMVELGYRARDGQFFTLASSNTVTTPQKYFNDAFNRAALGELDAVTKLGRRRPRLAAPSVKSEDEALDANAFPVSSTFNRTEDFADLNDGDDVQFHVDVEIVVKGQAPPNSFVTIKEEPIRLSPEGKFSVRYSLPERRHVFPVANTSRDGVETRTVVLAVDRNTKVLDPVFKEDEED